MEKRTFIKTAFLGITALLFPGKAGALEYYPNPSDKKWAVLYGTWCGSARDAGVWISEGMDGIANVFDVRENPDLSEYDNLIAGGAIRAGKISPLAKICDVDGLPSKVFLGRITFGLMEPDVRKQMQQMAGIKEYDNLKRDECMAFGKELLDSTVKT